MAGSEQVKEFFEQHAGQWDQMHRGFYSTDVIDALAEHSALGPAVANMVLHHVPDPAAMITEMARVVRGGGTVAITDCVEHIAGHRVIATEVNAGSNPDSSSSRNLRRLRDELGDRLIHSLVLHTPRHPGAAGI
ncbi:MAG: class I SAM-dependent methyltransferase [Streptosporangiaceae bacterium]